MSCEWCVVISARRRWRRARRRRKLRIASFRRFPRRGPPPRPSTVRRCYTIRGERGSKQSLNLAHSRTAPRPAKKASVLLASLPPRPLPLTTAVLLRDSRKWTKQSTCTLSLSGQFTIYVHRHRTRDRFILIESKNRSPLRFALREAHIINLIIIGNCGILYNRQREIVVMSLFAWVDDLENFRDLKRCSLSLSHG